MALYISRLPRNRSTNIQSVRMILPRTSSSVDHRFYSAAPSTSPHFSIPYVPHFRSSQLILTCFQIRLYTMHPTPRLPVSVEYGTSISLR